MKLENEFTVPASLAEAWSLMLDVERVAPCLPGATIEPGGGEGGEYQGSMTIKLGPITARYKGTVKIEQADEAAHRVALRAQAKDARGQGTAAATITSSLAATDDGTRVKVETDMRITGPAAQFGRGVMQDVSAKLMGQFADCLASLLSPEPAAPEAAADAPAANDPEAASSPAAEAAPAAPEPAATEPASADESAATEPTSADEPAVSEPAAAEAASAPAGEPSAPAAEPEAATRPSPLPPPPGADVLDLGAASRGAILKRAVPAVGALVALLVVLGLVKRKRGS